MTKRNDLPILLVSLLVTFGLLGGGFFVFRDTILNLGGPGSTSSASLDVKGADGSSGESVLKGEVSTSKQNGLDALARADFATAEQALTAALTENRNDPEALIYLNNAKIGTAPSHAVALIVPGDDDDTKRGTSQELMRGVAQAQTEINTSGGISGIPLRVLIVDDQDNPDIAKTIAASLAANTNVLGVIGHFSSGTTLEVAKIYEAEGLTLISPTSTSVDISQAGDYIFRTVPSDRLAASLLADYALDTLDTLQAAIFYNDDSNYSKSLRAEFETEFVSGGGEIVEAFNIQDASFRAADNMRTAREQGAEVIMLALSLDPSDPLLQILASNQPLLPMLGSDSLYKSQLLSLAGDNALGLTVAAPWDILSHEQSEFVQDSRQLWGADVNWRTAMAYDAAVALAEGIESEPTREGVAAALAASDFQVKGATSLVRFLPRTGDRNQPFQLVEVVPGDRSGTGYDFASVD
jgi:branched-chain amino acid transport system substrate-binding protein